MKRTATGISASWLTLLAPVAVAFFVGCTSEKVHLEQLIASEIREFPLKSLPAGSTVKSVSATVSAQSGLEFTGKAVVTVALPKLYSPIDPSAAVSADLKNSFAESFRTAVSEGASEMPIPIGKFGEFYAESLKSITPAFVEAVPEGYVVQFTYPGIDGRRSGEGVRFERVEPPLINWGDRIENIGGTVVDLPAGAKVSASPEAFVESLKSAFAEQLPKSVAAIRKQIGDEIASKRGALVGVWEGGAVQRIVDRSQFKLKISFFSSGQATGRLSEQSIIRGIGVSEIQNDLDFQGTWNITDSGVEVTATQKRWFNQGKQVSGPGSGEPATAEEEPLSPDPFTMKFSFGNDGTALTWYPVGTKIESAGISKIIAMVQVTLSKIAQLEESPATSEPPPTKKAAFTPKPIAIDGAPQSALSGTEPSSGTAPNSDTPQEGQSSAGKVIKAPDLSDYPTFTPSAPTIPEGADTRFPPTPMRGEAFPETRLRLLTVADVEGWNVDKLRYAINEMYARHGLTFKDKSIQNYFAKFSWYRPNPNRSTADIESAFSQIELSNKKFLAEFRSQIQTGSNQPEVRDEKHIRLPKTIFGPTDKFPDDIAGKGVVGQFLLVGTDMQGRPQLIARADAMNPFPRKFTVVNESVRDNPGVVLRIAEYTPEDRPRDKPFIIIKKDSGVGVYLVKDPFRD